MWPVTGSHLLTHGGASNMEFARVLAIPLLGTHPREAKTYVHTLSRMRMFTALFIITKKGPSTYKGKATAVHPCAGVLFSHKKK